VDESERTMRLQALCLASISWSPPMNGLAHPPPAWFLQKHSSALIVAGPENRRCDLRVNEYTELASRDALTNDREGRSVSAERKGRANVN